MIMKLVKIKRGKDNHKLKTVNYLLRSLFTYYLLIDLLLDMGGFDTTLYPWGQENIELSIRVWLCGTSLDNILCKMLSLNVTNL